MGTSKESNLALSHPEFLKDHNHGNLRNIAF